jgi:mannose-1-phosphate guanylyltransferase/mannose-6-phosphate isomerase
MIVPVILSGGAGTRLWPLSRELYPKQLLPLVSPQTMLQETLLRLDGMDEAGEPIVVCNQEHRFMVAEQIRQLGRKPAAIILEPFGRNTAPAVAVAALQALATGEDPVLLVLPADHLVRDRNAFQRAVWAGVGHAGQGRLVTFGIVPDRPETGYGYIKAGQPCDGSGQEDGPGNPGSPLTAYKVTSFVEKPDLASARAYLASGEYTWNSGMFMFRASRYLEELEKFAPTMLCACRRTFAARHRDLDFLRLGADAFAACPSDSVDYAVMERTGDAVVIPLAAGWSDIGSWAALWEASGHDADGNAIHGDVLTEGARDCLIHASQRMIAAVGVKGLIVVETADAVLVADKERTQDVKKVVERLRTENRGEALLHRRVNRPWGAYECINMGERFQVKLISVSPGASSSLQLHHHRSEHWVVVRGTARVTCGDVTRTLGENESIYIPLGVPHRLENPGKLVLELVEVQTGSYLGEDDIVRIEDQYGR